VSPSLDQIRAVPKVLLHDHLDGGLRPATVIELAEETGYADLPTRDPDELTKILTAGAHRGHLNLYLDAFRHTVGVLQTADGLRRVARECAEDLAADGIVYAEVRFAPELHTERGLTLDEVVRAVLAGFVEGSENRPIRVYALLTAMRTAARSLEIAELAVQHRDNGVVGFDIAGAEAGWPPSRHLDAFQYIHRENFHITIHAGEGFGLPSIWEAVQYCGTERPVDRTAPAAAAAVPGDRQHRQPADETHAAHRDQGELERSEAAEVLRARQPAFVFGAVHLIRLATSLVQYVADPHRAYDQHRHAEADEDGADSGPLQLRQAVVRRPGHVRVRGDPGGNARGKAYGQDRHGDAGGTGHPPHRPGSGCPVRRPVHEPSIPDSDGRGRLARTRRSGSPSGARSRAA